MESLPDNIYVYWHGDVQSLPAGFEEVEMKGAPAIRVVEYELDGEVLGDSPHATAGH